MIEEEAGLIRSVVLGRAHLLREPSPGISALLGLDKGSKSAGDRDVTTYNVVAKNIFERLAEQARKSTPSGSGAGDSDSQKSQPGGGDGSGDDSALALSQEELVAGSKIGEMEASAVLQFLVDLNLLARLPNDKYLWRRPLQKQALAVVFPNAKR